MDQWAMRGTISWTGSRDLFMCRLSVHWRALPCLTPAAIGSEP